MKQFLLKLLVLASFIAIVSCSKDPEVSTQPNITPTPQSTEWLIPKQGVIDGGPGKDGIPSIDRPQFTKASDVGFLTPQDLVLGINMNGDIRAYPHPILDWHEIVNDKIDNTPVAITYCPLTGTGIAWNRTVNGQETTFGVSGLLYNSNLIPYDRRTDSNWSQMLLKGVFGENKGVEITTYPLVETTWATWLKLYPDSKVLNRNTGFQRNYSAYPYGPFRTDNNFLIFPVDPDDDRLPRKARGLGVIQGSSSTFYALQTFNRENIVVKQDGGDLVIAGSEAHNFIVAFLRTLPDGTQLNFQPVNNLDNGTIMTDQEGNIWNIFGEAVEGPRTGTKLSPVTGFIGYWFAWGAFYPGIDVNP